MAYDINFECTNAEDFDFEIEGRIEDDTDEGTLIDWDDYTITFRITDNMCRSIDATKANGRITVTDDGVFRVRIIASDMASLCPGRCGVYCVFYDATPDTRQFIVGSLNLQYGGFTSCQLTALDYQ